MLAVTNGPDGIRTEHVAGAEPASGALRIRVRSAGICGTDVTFAAAGVAGFVYGHEIAGVGEDGRPYFVEPTIHCGHCAQCTAGHPQRCTEPGHGTLGLFRDGGMAQELTVPEYTLLPLPGGLPVTDACLVEPAAVAWHAVRRAGVRPGERVAVVGGGTIGLLAAAAARASGAGADVRARHDVQRAAARTLGFAAPAPDATEQGEYDVVVDAAGSASSLELGAALARPGGRVVVVGLFRETMPVPGVLSLRKELTYLTSMAYGHHEGVRDCARAAALLAADPALAATIITHRFRLRRAAEAFRVAGDRAAGAIKVVIEP